MNIEEAVNTTPGDDDASIPTDAAEMALKRSIHYVSDDVGASDEIGAPAEMPKNPKRRRGDGLHWTFNRKFVNMEDAMQEYCKEKLIERGLSKGRITRGKTIVYYYNCTMMTCGCMKKWRLRSSQTSLEFLEEETSEEHSNHNKHLRFEGRGISFAQEAIVEEAMASNLFKTTEIVNHFRYVAANGLKNGKSSNHPSVHQFNYFLPLLSTSFLVCYFLSCFNSFFVAYFHSVFFNFNYLNFFRFFQIFFSAYFYLYWRKMWWLMWSDNLILFYYQFCSIILFFIFLVFFSFFLVYVLCGK